MGGWQLDFFNANRAKFYGLLVFTLFVGKVPAWVCPMGYTHAGTFMQTEQNSTVLALML
jgi:hypothetical protein